MLIVCDPAVVSESVTTVKVTPLQAVATANGKKKAHVRELKNLQIDMACRFWNCA